jgi:hypothetical protein
MKNLKAGLGPIFKLFAAALLLAVSTAARAAELKAPSVTLPPLIVGPVAEAGSPLWKALDARAGAPAGQALALPQAPAPLEALSARVLARAAAEPQAAAALLAAHPEPAAAARLSEAVQAVRAEHAGSPELASLAAAAKADPAAAAFFDGAAARPSLSLDGIVSKGRHLKVSVPGQKKPVPLDYLGSGEFGVVYVHPKVEGAVIKAVEHGFEVSLFGNQTVTQTADEEEAVSKALAAADAGPRYFGRAVVDRRELSVRERVYGETMDSLARGRRFTEEERELVLDLLRRMAKARIITDDKRAPNIMIGTTLLDPRRRAYLIDGGHMLPVAADVTEEQLYQQLLHQNTILLRRLDPHVGEIEISKPFSQLLDEAVKRSKPRSAWQRVKEIAHAFVNARFAPR